MSLAKMTSLFQHGIEVFQLDEAVVVAEFTVPASWVGKSLQDLAVREGVPSQYYRLSRCGKTNRFIFRLVPTLSGLKGRVMAVTDNQYLDRIQDLLD